MKHFFTFLLVSFIFPCFSQQWDWARQATNTTGDQTAIDVCSDNMGNVFIIGINQDTAFYGSAILDSGSFVAKYNSSGALLWAKKLPGDVKDLVCDATGNLQLAGQFTGTINIDLFNLSSNGLTDIYIAKINPSGTILSAKSFGGLKNDLVTAMATDRESNIFITGTFQDSITFDTCKLIDNETNKYYNKLFYLVKTDLNGITQWAKTCPYNSAGNQYQYQSTSYLTVDKNGAAYITGEYIAFPCYQYCNGYYIMKYDFNGVIQLNNRQWNTFSFIAGLAVDDSLDILVEYHSGSHYTSELTLCKYNQQMNTKWSKYVCAYLYGTNFSLHTGLMVDTLNNIYLAGFLESTGQACTSFSSKGLTDIIIQKYDHFGNCSWTKTAGGPGYENYYWWPDPLCNLWVNKAGDCHITGNFKQVNQNMQDTSYFDSEKLVSAGNWRQIYVAKINNFNPIPTVLNDTHLSNENGIQIFPNPSSGLVTTSFSQPNIQSSIRIKDVLGNAVLNDESFHSETQLDLSSFPKGIYFLEIEAEKGKIVKKIILQ